MIAVAHPMTRWFPLPATPPLERPQDYGDLVRLMRTLQTLEVREPGQQAIRDGLLTKLSTVPSLTLPGGHQAGW